MYRETVDTQYHEHRETLSEPHRWCEYRERNQPQQIARPREQAVRFWCKRSGLMQANTRLWLVLMAGMIVGMASVQYSEAQSLPIPPSVRWPTEGMMATLTAKFRRPKSGQLFNDSNIIYGDVPLRFSPPGTTVTFPFRAVLEDDSKCGFGWGFTITVKRRGSARLGIPANLEILGHKGVIGRRIDPVTGEILEFSRMVTLRLPEERPPNQQGGNCLFSRGPLRHVEQDLTLW